ncbi:MAG TPA: hypothetical protein VKA87_08770, partial [Nitrososphaeraceae archaeon]|nr:hypothetical protein [Nitrososphaeraceae archaeon]
GFFEAFCSDHLLIILYWLLSKEVLTSQQLKCRVLSVHLLLNCAQVACYFLTQTIDEALRPYRDYEI